MKLLPAERITPPACVAIPVPLPGMNELLRRISDDALAANTPFVTLLLMVLRSMPRLIGLTPAVTIPWRLAEMTLSRTIMVIGPDVLFAAIPLVLNWILLFSMVTRALPPTAGCIAMPAPVDGTLPFDVIVLFVTSSVALPVLGWNTMPVATPELFP